ncbi:ribose 5-phosphate isomerase B [Salsuginibacillus kocurii]|uniref:ribose 5-phosphate isomerase B n=1 Tax=Salsuginibacillus kocurii TaxID=427078 RepID=UPI000366FAF8|nr:ribose 5-phosphate isomerase B [Salsuginibacillus kocurii]
MKVAIGCDHAGWRLKQEVLEVLTDLGIDYVDVGCSACDKVDFSDYAFPVAEKVRDAEAERGILICGTGIGMSIAANKVQGIRCALVHDIFSAKMTRLHNDSNVLAMGERVIGPGIAREIATIWLQTEFEKGRHLKRLNKLTEYEGIRTETHKEN